MDPNTQESATSQGSEAASRDFGALQGAPDDSSDDGQLWPLGPLADVVHDDPGSDPYNRTGRFARPIFK